LDVETAFLNAPLDEPIYMSPPEGIKLPSNQVFRLRKALYGLKQAPHQWNIHLSDTLKAIGLNQLKSDPSVFTFGTPTCREFIILGVYVDDILAAASDERLLDKLCDDLNRQFKIKNLGRPTHFLGMQIEQDKSGITIHQTNYLQGILDRFNLHRITPRNTPMDPNIDLSPQEDDTPAHHTFPYRQILGALMYNAITVNPTIAYAVSVLSQYASAPKQKHAKAIVHLLGFIKSHHDFAITFKSPLQTQPIAYCDASHANDQLTRRSRTGFLITLAGGVISYKSKLQTVVATSTAVAEYYAATDVTKEILWIQHFLREVGHPLDLPMIVYTDNLACIHLTTKPIISERTKHVDIRHHFIRDYVTSGKLVFAHLPTQLMPADALTKPLSKGKLRELFDIVNIRKICS
jgi:hypothetical protein